ncbi:MAG: hypothetical protein AB7V26_05685 [Lysobacterales bacterium]
MKRVHWLYRVGNIRRLQIAGGALLLVSVLAQFGIAIEAHFGVDGWFGFYAAFGLVACAAMVGVAKLLGLLVKRHEDYYLDEDPADAAAPTPGEERGDA